MKVMKNPVTWLVAFALQGCVTAPDTPQQPEQPPANLDEPLSIQPQTFIMRGQVVVGHESRTFTPCGSQQQYWLDLSPELALEAQGLSTRPYQALYGELIGHLTVPSQTGYNADFTARFVVDQVNILTAENPDRCVQPLRSTRVFGNEPLWSATFDKDQLKYTKMGEQPQTLDIESSRTTSSSRDYQLEGKAAQGKLNLTKESCSDGMSDSIYGWHAKLNLNDSNYNGCATVSNQDPTLDWSGLYFASSTQNSGFSINLELNNDHSAITTYSYSNGDPSIVEQGFWQQLNQNQVQVVMTRHQQQYLISERIFTLDNGKLIAEKEKVGNVVYPIANGGLVLFEAKSAQAQVNTTTNVDLTAKQVNSSDQLDPKVDQAIREYFKINNSSPDDTKYRWLTYDLNGDGKEELFAQLDWCGSGGCTLLIFENHQDNWRFNSRVTLVKGDIRLGKSQNHGWQDLIFNVSGGGATPAKHTLSYSGVSYPLNPSVAPVADDADISDVVLFADGISPAQSGVKL
ncbi:COG3650 family protein [Vibrio sp. 10N.247.311.12]|uniref:COG3650 family protein n=1 Tax=Vibrio sp. 10N.247.311.12 TaxID=3229991 RepID=UPI00354F4280